MSASACSSCSTASRSRWFVGSSRTRTLTPRAWSSARCARVRSPGESVAHERPTWSAPSPNFASSVRASTGRRPLRSTKRPSSVSPDRVCGALLPDDARDHACAEPHACPRRDRALRGGRAERRLAGAVRSHDRDPLARENLDVDGPRRNDPRWTTAPDSRREPATLPPGARSSSRSSHGSNGFSGSWFRSSSRSACRTLVRSACVARRSAPPVFSPSRRPCDRASVRRVERSA